MSGSMLSDAMQKVAAEIRAATRAGAPRLDHPIGAVAMALGEAERDLDEARAELARLRVVATASMAMSYEEKMRISEEDPGGYAQIRQLLADVRHIVSMRVHSRFVGRGASGEDCRAWNQAYTRLEEAEMWAERATECYR